MAALCRSVVFAGKNAQRSRNLSLSAITRFKEIVETKEGNTLKIRGDLVPRKDAHKLLKVQKGQPCILCTHNLEVKHTDVLILQQYLDLNGDFLPYHVTQLCRIQYKRIEFLIKMAKAAGLIRKSEADKKKLELGYIWNEYNTYYDENTLRYYYF